MNELSKYLVDQILLEDKNPIKKTVVIYVGRFQPMHKGHYWCAIANPYSVIIQHNDSCNPVTWVAQGLVQNGIPQESVDAH